MLNNQKIQNIEDVVLQLLMVGQLTKSVIGQRTGLSNTTVSDLINDMLRLGLIAAVGSEKSDGGRKSVIYSLNGKYGKFLGISMQEDSLQAVIADAAGTLLEERKYDRQEGESSIELLKRASLQICSAGGFLAVGIGVPGVVDPREQIVVQDRRLGWKNVPLKELMERLLYVPTYIDNAVNGLAALERYRYRRDEKEPGFVLVCREYPYRAAVVASGKLVRGNDRREADWNFEKLMEAAPAAARVIGIDEVVVAALPSGEGQGAGGEESPEHPDIRLIQRGMTKGGLGYGMALSAEIDWFHSVYFLLKSNN